ncbi:MAG: ATP-binding cassette domain-containing protein [Gemmatimonadaceae bacterium]
MTERAAALGATGIVRRYGDVTALDQVSLQVAAGECVALVGESGSGKTTLLRCFNKMVVPDAGQITVDGQDVAPMDAVQLRRRTGYVPQDGGLMPHWRVQRNVEMVPWLRELPDRAGLAREALTLVGLSPDRFGTRWPHELSGGQRQRVAIARALAAHPKVLLLDEPLGALDAISRGDLQDAIVELRQRLTITMVLVTHDLREATRLGDRIAVMRAGQIEQQAPTSELYASPATPYVAELLRRAEGGRVHP